MTGKSHKSIYYHVVIATEQRRPFIIQNIQGQVYHFIENKCKRLGLYLHRIGGVEDHIHMLIYIPPKMAVADVIGQLKGSSSYFVNKELAGDGALYWQKGYGIFSVSEDDLGMIDEYIKNQAARHKKGSISERFEELGFED